MMHEVKKKFTPVENIIDLPDDLFDKVKVESKEADERAEVEEESRMAKVEKRLKELQEKRQEHLAKLRSKADVRCEDIIDHGILLCKKYFAKKYKGCKDKVPLGFLDDLICWPFLLDGVCNIMKLLPNLFNFECNSDAIVPPDFNTAYARAKEAAKALSKSFKVQALAKYP